ncbi:MAG: LPS export ABC transporter permease LptF [Desulfonatronovibrionaceae bacterium]
MTILHRTMFREIGIIFSLCLVSALTLVVIGRFLQLKDLFMGQSVSLLDILKIFVFLSPSFLTLLIPIGCMLSIFLCFLRMATDRELTALQSAGLGIKSFVLSPLVFSCLCTGLTFLISFQGIPWGIDNFRNTTMEILETKARLVLQPGVFNTQFPGLTIFSRQVEPSTQELEGVFVRDKKQTGEDTVIVAPRGEIKSSPQSGELFFVLKNGEIYQVQDQESSVVDFSAYRLRLDTSSLVRDMDMEDRRPKHMHWHELVTELEDDLVQGHDRRKVIMEMHKKVALPLACLVLGMFAVPLAMSLEGLGRQYGSFLALTAFLVYYTFFTVSYSLGETGVVNPHYCVWASNMFFVLLTGAAFYMTVRGREINLLTRVHTLALLLGWKKEGADRTESGGIGS